MKLFDIQGCEITESSRSYVYGIMKSMNVHCVWMRSVLGASALYDRYLACLRSVSYRVMSRAGLDDA